MQQVFDESFAKEFPAVTRWFMTLVHQPQFAKVMGEVEMAKEPMKYDGKKSPTAAAPKKESKPEQPKKVQEKAPPAAKVGLLCGQGLAPIVHFALPVAASLMICRRHIYELSRFLTECAVHGTYPHE